MFQIGHGGEAAKTTGDEAGLTFNVDADPQRDAGTVGKVDQTIQLDFFEKSAPHAALPFDKAAGRANAAVLMRATRRAWRAKSHTATSISAASSRSARTPVQAHSCRGAAVATAGRQCSAVRDAPRRVRFANFFRGPRQLANWA